MNTNTNATMDSKPVRAIAGAADAAAGTLRNLSSRVAEVVSDESRRTEMRERVAGFQDKAREALSWQRRHELMAEIPARVRDAATQAVHQAARTYDDLADRGETVVARWRDEYRGTLGEKVVAIRGRVADATTDVAEAADRVADDVSGKAERLADDAAEKTEQIADDAAEKADRTVDDAGEGKDTNR